MVQMESRMRNDTELDLRLLACSWLKAHDQSSHWKDHNEDNQAEIEDIRPY